MNDFSIRQIQTTKKSWEESDLMSKLKIRITGLMLLCSTVLWGCSKDTTEAEQPPFVMVAQPKTSQNLQQSYAGTIQPRQETALSFRTGGQVIQRRVDVGDRVHEGQVLAELDVQDAELQMKAAKAQLESAEAQLKNLDVELKRLKQLLPIHAISRSQYDATEQQYKASRAAVEQAKANYEVAQNQTKYNRLIANEAGVITARQIEVGQVVAAGQAVYHQAISNAQDVVIGVPEQVISEIKKGQAAWVSVWSQPDQKIAGTIREISPAADQSRTYMVKVAVDTPTAGLQFGQSARVFVNQAQDHILRIPLASVSASDQHAYVMVVNANHIVRQVPVTIGAYEREYVSILSGLNAQDYVVVGGIHLLRDKQKVKPIDRENRAVKIQAGVKP